MILVDTSVVIEWVRSGSPKLAGLFAAHDAAICGVTRAEVLHGTRSPAHRPVLVAALDSFRQVPVPDALWDPVGDNHAALRRSGVTVPLADVVIATVAIHNGVALWTRDAHFKLVQRVLPALQLFTEPP